MARRVIARVFVFARVARAVVAVAVVTVAGSACLDDLLDPPAQRAPTVAVFDPANGLLPFPHDALLLGSDDGTVDVPLEGGDDAPAGDPRRALNELDGFSITEAITIPFSRSLDPGSVVVGDSVRVFAGAGGDELDGDAVAAVVDGSGRTLRVVPLAPFPAQTTIIVIVTDDVVDEDGVAVAADRIFKIARSDNALVDGDGHARRPALITDADARALEPLRALTSLACTPARLRGLVDDELVMCLPVTTQSLTPAQGALDDAGRDAVARGVVVARVLPLPITGTETLGLPGLANLHVGALRVPRFIAADDDPERALTGRFAFDDDGALLAQGDEIVPLLLAVPKTPKPAGGWPVVVFQHGVTRDRTDVIAVADAFAAAGVVAVAADLPLHGLTGDPAHVFAALNGALDASADAYAAGFFEGLRPVERTLGLDLVDNATQAPGADGVVDASGTHLLNLASLLTTRDTLRQATGDVRALGRAARVLDVDGDGASDVDGSVAFVGHSLGAIVGASACALDARNDDDAVFDSCALVSPGAQLARLFQGSPTFGPRLLAGLARNGVGDDDVDGFLGLGQAVLDGADPWATSSALRDGRRPLLVVDVAGDAVVPERVPLFPLAGGLPFIQSLRLPLTAVDRPLGDAGDLDVVGNGAVQRVRVRFVRGDHVSLLTPAAAADVTAALHTLLARFVASGGRVVDVDAALVTADPR